MEIMDVGQRIAKLRKEKGWSQMGLAEKLNVSDKTVSKWENGGMPGIDLFPKISDLFNVSIDYLMTGQEKGDSIEPLEVSKSKESSDDKTDDKTCDKTDYKKNTSKGSLIGNLNKEYICPNCKQVNRHPGAYCSYCFYEFDKSLIEASYETNSQNEVEEIDVIYDEQTGKPICPKCNRVNPYFDTNCIYCYYQFKKPKQKANNTGSASPSQMYFSNRQSKTYNQSSWSSKSDPAGCLLYLIAFLLPIIGLIIGLTRRDKTLTVFSVVIMVIPLIIYIIAVLSGALLLAAS